MKAIFYSIANAGQVCGQTEFGPECFGGESWNAQVLPEYFDYGPTSISCSSFSGEAGNEYICLPNPASAGQPEWYTAGPGYYGTLYPARCYTGGGGEFGPETVCEPARRQRLAGSASEFQQIIKWYSPAWGVWAEVSWFYGWPGNPLAGFPGNAVSNLNAVNTILAPFGDDALQLAHEAAARLMLGRGIEPYWTPAEANSATIIQNAVTAALSAPQFANDKRAQAVLAYFFTADWAAKKAQAAQSAYQQGVSHAAANESNSVFQGFIQAFSGFMQVAGPLMLITGAFGAVLAAITEGVAAGAAVAVPEMTAFDIAKAAYQLADVATPGDTNFGLPINPFSLASAATNIGNTLTAALGVDPNTLTAALGVESIAPPAEIAMPIGQFDTYPDMMGMDTGNLGLDVPAFDAAFAVDPLADVPFEAGFPVVEVSPEVAADFGGVYAVGEFQAEAPPYVDAAGTAWYYDADGNVIGAMNADGSYYLPDSSGTLEYAGAMDAAAASAAAASGFSLDSILKLASTGLSIYSAIQKLGMDRDLAARGIRPGTTAATGQTRTVRDPRTGLLVTQRLDPLTGQWVAAGGVPGAPGAPGGLSQTIGGLPAWAWLAGGGVLLLAMSRGGRR